MNYKYYCFQKKRPSLAKRMELLLALLSIGCVAKQLFPWDMNLLYPRNSLNLLYLMTVIPFVAVQMAHPHQTGVEHGMRQASYVVISLLLCKCWHTTVWHDNKRHYFIQISQLLIISSLDFVTLLFRTSFSTNWLNLLLWESQLHQKDHSRQQKLCCWLEKPSWLPWEVKT